MQTANVIRDRAAFAHDERTISAFRIARLLVISLSMSFPKIVTTTIAFLLFVSGRRWRLTYVVPRFSACLIFLLRCLILVLDAAFAISLSSFSLFLSSLSLSFIVLFASSRVELWGKRQGGGIGRGSRVDEGRGRETVGGRAVR